MKINSNPSLASLVSSLYDPNRNSQNVGDANSRQAAQKRLDAQKSKAAQQAAAQDPAAFQSLDLKQTKQPAVNSFAREAPNAGAAEPKYIQPGQHLNILV